MLGSLKIIFVTVFCVCKHMQATVVEIGSSTCPRATPGLGQSYPEINFQSMEQVVSAAEGEEAHGSQTWRAAELDNDAGFHPQWHCRSLSERV